MNKKKIFEIALNNNSQQIKLPFEDEEIQSFQRTFKEIENAIETYSAIIKNIQTGWNYETAISLQDILSINDYIVQSWLLDNDFVVDDYILEALINHFEDCRYKSPLRSAIYAYFCGDYTYYPNCLNYVDLATNVLINCDWYDEMPLSAKECFDEYAFGRRYVEDNNVYFLDNGDAIEVY